MIIGDNREQVIQNIKQAIEREDFSAKVEIGDPVMSLDERKEMVDHFWAKQNNLSTKVNNVIGKRLFKLLTHFLTNKAKIVGLNYLKDLPTNGAIVTTNHFNQIDCFPMAHIAHKTNHDLAIVIEDTNLQLPNILGYLMNYIGSIPLVNSPSYVGTKFPKHLHAALKKNNWILIYPEQEMWWNYRKPRKLQRGAYYYAAKFKVPVISTFVELVNLPKLEKDHPNFEQVRYVIHVLPTIHPDSNLSVRQNSQHMLKKDYQQKVAAYEQIYQKKLDYAFTSWDIAGWLPNDDL